MDKLLKSIDLSFAIGKFRLPENELLKLKKISNHAYSQNDNSKIIKQEFGSQLFINIESNLFTSYFNFLFECSKLYISTASKGKLKLNEQSIIGSWFVESKFSEAQKNHSHFEDITSIAYIEIPKDTSKENGHLIFNFNSLESQSYPRSVNEHESFYPKEGDLIIFPSKLEHKTMPTHSPSRRVILSSNAKCDLNCID